MFSSKILLPVLFALSLLFVPLAAYAQDEKHVSVRLVPSELKVKGGETITMGIEQTISPGWHTYWINPGDSGSATRISWSGLDGMKAGTIQWPVPKKLPMGPLVNFGYEDSVTLLQDLTIPETIPDGPIMITAMVEVLVCKEICIPETHHKSIALNFEHDSLPVGVALAQQYLPLDVPWRVDLSEENGNLKLSLVPDNIGDFHNKDSIELYPEEWGIIDNTQNTIAVADDRTLYLEHKRGERALSDVPPSKFVIAYKDERGNRKAVRVAMSHAVPEVSARVSEPNATTDTSQSSFIGAILFAMLGGLILNLMPCVFPVLSMKALSLVKLKDEETAKARWHGIFYTLGILFSFALIAALLLSLKAGGAEIGWGFQLQNPAIILGLAYLFFILGLNLAGYFDIDFGLSNIGSALTQRSGLSGSFFTGVLATVVATPCTAPFMATAIGYALTQSAAVSIAVFLSLGFGLALPYLLLTMVPALRHALPKPGRWMETFRQFLSFPMFATTLWLMWVLSQQIGLSHTFNALIGLLAITFALWMWKARPMGGIFKYIVILLSALSFLYAGSLLWKSSQDLRPQPPTLSMSDDSSDGVSYMFTQAALDEALAGNDPVFVNMTAAWCITCKLNEKVALNQEKTQALFKEQKVKYFKGDWTNQNPEITKFLESYGRSGVPLYVYYAPKPTEGGQDRPQPVVLPQILTPDIIEKTILGDPDA